MASPKAYTPKGFSLIEMLVVVGILALLASMTMVIGVQAFNRSSVKDDRNVLVGALQKARSEAIHGVCTEEGCIGPSAQGVHITDKAAILFEGTTYNPNDPYNQSFSTQSAMTHFGGAGDVVFAAGSGDTASSSIQVYSGTDVVSIITVGALGEISWTY